MSDRRAYYKQWRADNPKRVKELHKRSNKTHNERYSKDPAYREHWKRTIALQRYKMTPSQFDEQLKTQGGHCALCEVTHGVVAQRKHSLHVDHDHSCCEGPMTCGKCRRGILCVKCNNRLGFLEAVLKESTIVPIAGTWTARAIAYLKSYEPKPYNWTEEATLWARLMVEQPRNGIYISNVQVPSVL